MRSSEVGIFLVSALLMAGSSWGQETAAEAAKLTVQVAFEGNDELTTADLRVALRGLVADIRQSGVDGPAIEDGVYILEGYYASRGFPRAKVSGRSEQEGAEVSVFFKIEEGYRTFVRSVQFKGNGSLDSSALEQCFDWETSGVLGLGTNVFARDKLAEGVACIIARYQAEGWYFVEAAPETVEEPEGQVLVTVSINEGPRVFLREVSLVGVELQPLAEVRAALQLELPAVYAPRLPLILKGRVLDFYRRRGHRFVDVHVAQRVDREPARAALELRVEEGPLARIAALTIEPKQEDRRTWDSVIRRYIKLRPGDLYDEDLVRQSYRGLLRSGLFDSVNIETEALDGASDRLLLTVRVTEKARYRIVPMVGFGSYELLRGSVTLEDINVFGSGHSLRLQGGASFKSEFGKAEYLNPFFFFERLSQDAEVLYERRQHPSFTKQEYGGVAGLGYRFTERLRSRLFYRLRENDVLDVETDLPPDLEEDVFLSSFNLSFAYDTRTNILNPDRGSTHRLTIEYSGSPIGSELDFVRVTGSSSWIFPLFDRVRLVPAARLGVIQRLEDTDVIPIQERFFLGGESSIRSFKEDEAGPMIDGDPVGGEAFVHFNLELRFPLEFHPLLEGLDGVVFGDTGSLSLDIDDFAGGRYFFAVGTGLRYNTPVGPFRLDFAFNPDRDSGEDSFVVHFGLGYPF